MILREIEILSKFLEDTHKNENTPYSFHKINKKEFQIQNSDNSLLSIYKENLKIKKRAEEEVGVSPNFFALENSVYINSRNKVTVFTLYFNIDEISCRLALEYNTRIQKLKLLTIRSNGRTAEPPILKLENLNIGFYKYMNKIVNSLERSIKEMPKLRLLFITGHLEMHFDERIQGFKRYK